MDTPSYNCWYCYRPNPRPDGKCGTCAQPIRPPAGTSPAEVELWALSHPQLDRRLTAIDWLGRHHETRALRPLHHLAADPAADPSLAAAAAHSLTTLSHLDVQQAQPATAAAPPTTHRVSSPLGAAEQPRGPGPCSATPPARSAPS